MADPAQRSVEAVQDDLRTCLTKRAQARNTIDRKLSEVACIRQAVAAYTSRADALLEELHRAHQARHQAALRADLDALVTAQQVPPAQTAPPTSALCPTCGMPHPQASAHPRPSDPHTP